MTGCDSGIPAILRRGYGGGLGALEAVVLPRAEKAARHPDV